MAGTVARIPRYLNLAQALIRDPAVSGTRRATILLGFVYAISPIDFIPGVIPLVGQLDDLAALLLALRHALGGLEPDAADAHLSRVGLSHQALDADLRTVLVAGVWVVARTASIGSKLVTAPLRWLGRPSKKPAA